MSLLGQLLEQEDGDGVDSECIQKFATRSLRFLLLRRISSSDTFFVFFSMLFSSLLLSLMTTSDDADDDDILGGEVDDEGKDENIVGRNVSVLVVGVVELPLSSCGVLLLLLSKDSKEASSCIVPIEDRTLNTLDRFGCG